MQIRRRHSHRIIEWLMLEKTSVDHLVQAPCSKKGQLEQVLRTSSSCILRICNLSDNLFQWSPSHLLGKTDFKLNVFVCRTWLNLSATTVSPSSFIRYKDGYSEHTSGFIVFRNSEITKSYHTLRGKLTKEKRKPLSDSILILRDQRCALLSSTEIKWKKREKEKTKNLSWYHYIDKSHYCTSTFSADAKIIHVAIACITSAAFCPSILYSRSPLPALKVLLVWKLYFFTEVYLRSLSKERIHSNTS